MCNKKTIDTEHLPMDMYYKSVTRFQKRRVSFVRTCPLGSEPRGLLPLNPKITNTLLVNC